MTTSLACDSLPRLRRGRAGVGAVALVLALSACSTDRYIYVPAAGVSLEKMAADLEACQLEAGVAMLPEDRVNMERSCMLQHGYDLKREGG